MPSIDPLIIKTFLHATLMIMGQNVSARGSDKDHNATDYCSEDGATVGRRSVNVVPWLDILSTVMDPPCFSERSRVDYREAQAGPLPAFFGHGDSATASSWVSSAAAHAGLALDMTTERVLTMLTSRLSLTSTDQVF
jgi:hypothetical protein